MARPLRDGVEALELTSKVTLAVLALASGVYTYLGVRDLLDGSAVVTFFAAVIYSAAVSVGIYAFWTFLMRFMPHVRHGAQRRALILAMILGSIMIMAMSSWLNAAALAGSAAIEQHLARAAEGHAEALDKAHNNALAAQSLLPDIQLASERFSRLAAQEQSSGALTGTSGSGTVVQLLSQMANDLRGLGEEIAASRETVSTLYETGGEHISRMRALVSASGPVKQRADAFGEEALALGGVIASLQQTSVAPAVRRAADDLASTFIAPIADGGTDDLRDRQTTVVGNVAAAVAAQSKQLANAADEILATEPVRPERFVPLSAPDAVLRYAGDFLPSWAGAISIDLLPAVLVMILVAVHAAIRREEDPRVVDNVMTAADMMQAMRLYERMRREELATGRLDRTSPEPNPEEPETRPAPHPATPAAAERVEAQNVTSLPPQRGRSEAG
ncbi:MAG TPA: hypothetical protein VN240_07220 [Propylenella sp.]|nr:hypothetical protein [Propylenella sp.]